MRPHSGSDADGDHDRRWPPAAVEQTRILPSSHETPDGDAVGSAVALMLMADRLGISASGLLPR